MSWRIRSFINVESTFYFQKYFLPQNAALCSMRYKGPEQPLGLSDSIKGRGKCKSAKLSKNYLFTYFLPGMLLSHVDLIEKLLVSKYTVLCLVNKITGIFRITIRWKNKHGWKFARPCICIWQLLFDLSLNKDFVLVPIAKLSDQRRNNIIIMKHRFYVLSKFMNCDYLQVNKA